MRGHGRWMGGMAYVVACKMMPVNTVSDNHPIQSLQKCLTRWSSIAWSNIPTRICLDYKFGVRIAYQTGIIEPWNMSVE